MRRDAYVVVDPIMGHDLSFPFRMVKRGWLASTRRERAGEEKMVPTIEGEFARKRRMMSTAGRSSSAAGCCRRAATRPLYA